MSFDFFTTADMLTRIFWVCALGGTLFFVLRVGLMFIGGDLGDADVDLDIDMDSSDAAFDFISLNTVTAFVMMFGWSGLTAYVQYKLGHTPSIIVAIIAGVLAMLITGFLFQQARKLVSTGSSFTAHKTIGLNATVYQQIPAEGKGKINVTVPGGMIRELDAISKNKTEIESQTTVKVIDVVDNNTVSVEKI